MAKKVLVKKVMNPNRSLGGMKGEKEKMSERN